jgi:hypothetical protein
MPPDDPLAGLRALHLPPETHSVWADLGLAVAAGLAIALVVAFAARLFLRPKHSLRASALEAFEHAKALPPDDKRAAQAALLRRIVRTVEGEAAARAAGPEWSATLDRVLKTDLFSARSGKSLTEQLYARPARRDADDPELDRELAGLLERLRR